MASETPRSVIYNANLSFCPYFLFFEPVVSCARSRAESSAEAACFSLKDAADSWLNWSPAVVSFGMFIKNAFRALSGAVLTFFIILLLDLQLRTRKPPRPYGASLRGGFAHPLRNAEPHPGGIPGLRWGQQSSDKPPQARRKNSLDSTSSNLELKDIFIAVKTTGRFHRTRLALLFDTWISKTKEHVSSLQLLPWKLTLIIHKLQNIQDHAHICIKH